MRQHRPALFIAICSASTLIFTSLAVLSGLGAPTPSVQAQSTQAWTMVERWSNPPGPAPAGFVREASALDLAPDGTLYVADAIRGQLHVRLGEDWVGTIGEPGKGPGQLDEPRGVAVLDDRVYVADPGNQRVTVYERSDGSFVTSWGGLGTPWGIARLADDRMLVSDEAGDRLLLVDLNGQVQDVIGSSGTEEGELNGPRGVAAWPDGQLAVLEEGNRRVQVLNLDGSVALTIPNGSLLPQVDVGTLGEDGLLLATLRNTEHFDRATAGRRASNRAPVPGGFTAVGSRLETSGTHGLPVYGAYVHDYVFGLRRFDDTGFREFEDWRGLPAPAGEFESPRRIVADADGLEVLDAFPRVQRLALDGTPIEQIEVDPPEELLTFGADRFMQNGTLLRRTRGLSETWRWVHPDSKAWLVGLAHDRTAGELHSLDISRQELLTIDEDGLTVITRSLNTSGFQAYTDLDLAPDGQLMLINRTQKTLERRTTQGALVGSWGIQGVPLRVAADPDTAGGAFVLTREGWIWRLDASGNVIAWWDAAADAIGPRGIPSDLTVGPDGRVYITDAGANEVRAYAIDPQLSPPPPPSGQGCSFLRDKWASPTRLRLGESTAVTLTVSGTCFEEGQGADIILVVDRSGSMAGRKMETARAAAMAFIGEIDFDVSRVGLVVFSAGAEQPLGLSDDPAALVESIAGFDPPIGGTNIGAGLQMATQELTSTGRTSVERIIVVMTDGRPEGNVVDTDMAADAAKAEGIRLFSIGFGTDVDPNLMQRIASAPEDYFFAPGATELSRIYTEIARRITGGVIAETATITDVVPSNMQLMPETVQPPPASIVDKTITWELAGVREDIQLGYRVIPLEIGTWPTNVEAWYRYLDGLGIPGRLKFPVPEVIVEGPPEPIFLPIVGKPFCRPKRQHTDVALVLDTSSSMDGAKLAAAKDAGVRFVERLELPKDQAAVVDFNTQAQLRHALSGDGASLAAAIRALDWTPGTRVDEGLRLAVDELTGPRRRPENTAAIVLLTDGLNNAGPAPVLEMARRAAGAGIIVYTIALGDDADRALMEQVAGDPARAFVAVGPADLDRIYGEIAGEIACP